jgi:hypothetical protein
MTIDGIVQRAVGDDISHQAALVAVLERLWMSAWFTDLRSPLSGGSVITIAGSAA